MIEGASETVLAGGNMNAVVRAGAEVRRPAGAWTANVHALLRALERSGISETPRALGIAPDGRERLSYLPGEAAHYPLPEWLWDDAILMDSARLLRRIHDASAGLARIGTGWRSPVREPVEVVCHNDFAPYNLIFDRHRLVGVIDFDTASPGPRLWDLAYLAYRLVPYVEDAGAPVHVLDAEERRRELLLSAYGSDASAQELWLMMATRLDALAEDSRRRAQTRPELDGHAAMYERDAARLRARAERG
ncbi:phosphotransferase [Microbacterium sp. CIAB417]|uniref:phosphotransferase n=1 Tax=Microbacterium sp. CIAB417 TaxID=2860287 RepID=UPI001FABCC91|nr:phosphotransferase [Microbacterium sp. CIAB417]